MYNRGIDVVVAMRYKEGAWRESEHVWSFKKGASMPEEMVVCTVERVLPCESQKLPHLLALFGSSDKELVGRVKDAGGFEAFLATIPPLPLPNAAVVLVAGEKRFAIFVGPMEGAAIERILRGIVSPRPMTNDLCLEAFTRLSAGIGRAAITEIRDGTFIGALTVKRASGEEDVFDCRPSDLIALALAAKVPIEVSTTVLAAVEGVSKFLNSAGTAIEVPINIHFAEEDVKKKRKKPAAKKGGKKKKKRRQ